MYYLILVSQAQGGGHLSGYADGLFVVQPSPSSSMSWLEALAVDELHDYKMYIAFLAYVIDIDYVRMR